MSKNTDRGYGFEYINVVTANRILGSKIAANTQNWVNNGGKLKFEALSVKEQGEMIKASEALMKFLYENESWVSGRNVTVERVRAQGGSTDVSDILFKERNNAGSTTNEVGISLKSNHEAVKHQRISHRIDIGNKWLGVPSGNEFMLEVKKLFADFIAYCKTNSISTYEELGDSVKDTLLYTPVCNLVKKLLGDIFGTEQGSASVSYFMNYLIGSKDFYKAVASFKDHELKIVAFNLRGTLSKGKRLKSPQRCLDIQIQNSDRGYPNRVHIVLDNGWEVNLRVHNASSRVESSLKWDSQLVGIPNDAWQTRLYF